MRLETSDFSIPSVLCGNAYEVLDFSFSRHIFVIFPSCITFLYLSLYGVPGVIMLIQQQIFRGRCVREEANGYKD